MRVCWGNLRMAIAVVFEHRHGFVAVWMEGQQRGPPGGRRHAYNVTDENPPERTQSPKKGQVLPNASTKHAHAPVSGAHRPNQSRRLEADEEEELFRIKPPDYLNHPHFMRAVNHFDACSKPRASRSPVATPSLQQKTVAPPIRDVDEESLVPSLISCEEEENGTQLTDMQEKVFAHFASQQLRDHVCTRPAQPFFVGADADPSGTSAAYALYKGPGSFHNSAQLISEVDSMPAHMAGRTRLGPTALCRRAELRGIITALEMLLQLPHRPICAHLCVSSAYVVKAWGVWIPQWEAYGWPGEDVDAATRRRNKRFTRRMQLMSIDSSSSDSYSRKSDSTDNGSPTFRRTNRRLVDEDLLRELAALRTSLADIDARGGPSVYLYQIERKHNPADSLAIHCVLSEAPPLESDVFDESHLPVEYQPVRVISPPRLPAQDYARKSASPMPDDVFVNSPLSQKLGKRSPKTPTLNRATSPNLRAVSPLIGASPSRTMYTSPKLANPPSHGSPVLSVKQSSDAISAQTNSQSYLLHPSPASHSISSSQSPSIPLQAPSPHVRPESPPPSERVSLSPSDVEVYHNHFELSDHPQLEPRGKKLTADALREHDRKTGFHIPLWRRGRKAGSSVKSESVHSFMQRITPKALKKNKSQTSSPVSHFSTPRPALRTSASQPALRKAAEESKLVRHTNKVSPPVLKFEAEPAAAQNIRKQMEEVAQLEERLARQEVELERRRLILEKKSPVLRAPAHKATVFNNTKSDDEEDLGDYINETEDNDWLWESNFRRAPRIKERPITQEQKPKASSSGIPHEEHSVSTSPRARHASPILRPRVSKWQMLEEVRERNALPHAPKKDALGLYVDGDGFGSAAALSKSSPYFRSLRRKHFQYPLSDSEDSSYF